MLPFVAHLQSELLQRYTEYCNEIVPDTVTQLGRVTNELVPVMIDNQVAYYVLGVTDTTWFNVTCAEYKSESTSKGGINISDAGNTITISSTPVEESGDNYYHSDVVRRNYICLTLRCRVEDSEFLKWVEENGY
jgi:hypothetical protein